MSLERKKWAAGSAPVTVVMLTLNEEHSLRNALENISDWAANVFIVDSLSSDRTVDIALEHGATVVQRPFSGFGDQWNFAIEHAPQNAPWTMKLDPDERLSPELKDSLKAEMNSSDPVQGLRLKRRLYLMGERLPVVQELLRAWRTGSCRFSDVSVNEHPFVKGKQVCVNGELEHHDSPDLGHWLHKQNSYTTAEASARFRNDELSAQPRLLGSSFERRMWLKKKFWSFPFRYAILYLYHLLVLGAWRSGRVGFIWCRLRTEVFRMIEYKEFEMRKAGSIPQRHASGHSEPDTRVEQFT